MNFNLPSSIAPIGFLVVIAFWIATAMIHIIFALAVHRDAASLNRQGTGTIFASPLIWSLSVLIGGVFLAAIYWAMHHSAFRRVESIPENPGPYIWQPPDYSSFYKQPNDVVSNQETSVNDIHNDKS